MKKFSLFCLGLCLLAVPTHAGVAFLPPAHALAMHGAPRYPDGFKNFDYVNPDAPKGGTLRLGVVGTFDNLNPFIVRGTVPALPAFTLTTPAAIYEPLMARNWDEPFTLYALVAETVEVAQDRSAVIFHIRKSARWQDGQPLTPEDVLFSYQTLKEQGLPHHRRYYKKIAKATKVGEDGVRFDFKREPNGSIDREMPLIMASMPLLPAHYWRGKTFNQTTLDLPLASGPYKITAVDQGRSLTLSRDPDYWGKDLPTQKGQYNFDTIRIDFYRDDSIALQAFKSGAYDLRREGDPKKWVKLADEPAAKEGRLVMRRYIHHRPEPFNGFILNTRRPLMQDIVLRRALAKAFDFDWINRALLYGYGKRTQSVYPNAELAAKQTESKNEDQRTRLLVAAAELKRAGYSLSDGMLYAPSRQAVSFEVMLADPNEEKIALEWARNLQRLGIQAKIRTVDSAQYQGRLTGFDFDVTTGRVVSSASPGNEQMNYWSCTAARQNGSRNYAGICDPHIDALAASISQASSREELVRVARALDQALMDGAYVVPFYYQGVDPVAYWKDRVVPSPRTPAYGPIIESWSAFSN